MAMWQIIRHFFWVAASGFSLPRGLAPYAWMRVIARFSFAVSLRF
jgi:hypothetical protein